MSDLSIDVSEMNVFFVHSALDDHPLTPTQFRVFGHLVRRAGSGEAWPSIKSIAKHCRIKEDTAREVIHDLLDYNMLTRTERQGRTPIYKVTKRSQWIPAEQVLQLQATKKAKGQAKRAAKKADKAASQDLVNDQPLPPFGRGTSPEWGEGGTPELGKGPPSRMGGAEVYPVKDLQEEDPGVTAGGEPDLKGTCHSEKLNASSSEKDLAELEEKIFEATPAQPQTPSVQAAADLPSQDKPAYMAGNAGENQPEDLEKVPAAGENIHEPEQSETALAPTHDPAVDARLNQICNGRWLNSPKGTTDPAWIDEMGSAGVDRHQIAGVVTLGLLETFEKEAKMERLDMHVAKVNPNPQVCTLVIRKCEAYLTQRLQPTALAERQAQPQTVPQAGEVRSAVAVQWAVGEAVTYCRERYVVLEVGDGYILLDSEANGSLRINLTTSDVLKIRPLAQSSLDIDGASAND